MKIVLRLLAVVLLATPVFAADPPGFQLWRASELKTRDENLGKKYGPDHSSRETLGEYTDHRFRLIRRDADGFPEQHDNIVDVVIVESGSGTLQLGGKMLDPKSNSPGEYLGSKLEGGEKHAIAAGDVMHIPAKIPHAFLVPQGGHITYILVKFPGK